MADTQTLPIGALYNRLRLVLVETGVYDLLLGSVDDGYVTSGRVQRAWLRPGGWGWAHSLSPNRCFKTRRQAVDHFLVLFAIRNR